MTLNEVADLIVSPHAETLLRGNYVNKRGVRGYFVQIKRANHWCKVSVSNADHHSARVTVEELEAIECSMLQPAVLVPTSSISDVLESHSAQQTPVNTYLNSADIEGIWAEFRHAANWYMVTVSAFLPAPPALLSYPAAPGPVTSSASMSVHSSFQNCYAFCKVDLLSRLIAP